MRGLTAFCAGMVSAILLAVLLAGAFPGLTFYLAGVSLAAGLAVGLGLWRFLPGDEPVRWRFWDVLVLSAFALASFRAFFWLLYPDGDNWMILSPHNLGDLSLHIGLIRYFASGVRFWPDNPVFAGEPLAYPPGADLFNALLLLVGMDLRGGLVFVGFTVALMGGWALWKYGGAFAVAAFLFGGGLLGFAVFKTWTVYDFSSGNDERETIWKNPFLTMLVTQRGFLFALPMGLTLLAAWKREFFGEQRRVIPLGFQILIYSLLPLFQVHTFLFLSALLATVPIFQPARWLAPVRLVALSLVPGAVAMYFVTAGFSSTPAFRFEPFWAAPEGGVGFLMEFGVALALGVALLVCLRKSGDRAARWLAWTSAVLALFAFLFPLHSWAWDNTKLLIWSWITISPLLWTFVLRPLPLAPRVSLCVLLFFTGCLSLTAGLDRRHGYQLANLKELREWQVQVSKIPLDAIFAAEPDYNHPLILLGRRVVCGYEGHLSSHGLDYKDRMNHLRLALTLRPGWQTHAKSTGADFLVLRENDDRGLLILPVD